MDAESSGLGAVAGVVVTTIAGVAVKLFGTRAERDASMADAAEEWREHARQARAEREACERRARETEADLVELRDRLTGVEVSYATVEARYETIVAEHAQCHVRIARMEEELRLRAPEAGQ